MQRKNYFKEFLPVLLAFLVWVVFMIILFLNSCRTPTTGTQLTADVPISANVGAGDDDKVARHFDVKAKGESIVIITYHSNDQPEAIDTIYSDRWVELLRLLIEQDSLKKR